MRKLMNCVIWALVMVLLFAACGRKPAEQTTPTETTVPTTQPTTVAIPWENGGKAPSEYTLDEFDALSNTLQVLFENSFASRAEFDAWILAAQYAKYGAPWADAGKQPSDYTWEEFEALTAEQQIIFQNSFETFDAFDQWLQQAQAGDAIPTIDVSGKSLWDYTWEEFEAMDAGQQMAFQNSFESLAEFDSWLMMAQYGEVMPTIDQGDKSIWEYTWDEFENMTVEEQMAFQNSFGSLEAFDQWLQEAQQEQMPVLDLPWENGGKRPEDYTWAEFEALDPDLQIVFQNSFETEDGFENWLRANMP